MKRAQRHNIEPSTIMLWIAMSILFLAPIIGFVLSLLDQTTRRLIVLFVFAAIVLGIDYLSTFKARK